MKKILSIFCVVTLLCALVIPVGAAGMTVSFGSYTGTVEANGTVTLPVVISNNTGVTAANISLAYSDGLTITAKPTLTKTGFSTLTATTGGDITKNPYAVNYDGVENDTSNGELFTITFQAPATPGSYTVTLTGSDAYDENLDDVIIQGDTATITVQGSTPVTPTAKTVTYSATNGKVIASLTELSEGTPVASGTITTEAADSDEVYFYFFPDKGYTADGMTVNGATTIGDGARKFTITEDTTLSFEFKSVSGTATASAVTIVEKSADKLTVFGTATGASDFGLELGLQDKTMTKYAADGADGDGNFAITLSGTGIFGTAKTYAANIYADKEKGTVTTFTID